jgi:predicted N-acetyltransferase YhbS
MTMNVVAAAFRIGPATAVSASSIECLYDRVFGPPRFEKASHRLRTGLPPLSTLSWIAREGTAVIGAIRYWPILVGAGEEPALLLGPLAVAPEQMRRGIGTALVTKTLSLAALAGHDLVLLVGDPAYYRRFGFVAAAPLGFVMPGETRPDRLLVLSLQCRALRRSDGALQRSPHPMALQARAS